jgi:hypothetical protein
MPTTTESRVMKNLLLVLIVILSSGCASIPQPSGLYEIELVPLHHNETRHIKYNKSTGEAWWSSNTTWKKIKEEGAVSRSIYEIKVVSTGKSWRAIRIDTVSGKTWKNSKGRWVAFKVASTK